MSSLTPQASFVEFCKTFGFKEPPKFMIEVADKLQNENKSNIVVGFCRGRNWIAYWEDIFKTLQYLKKGEKCVLASRFPKRYIDDVKKGFNANIELIEIGKNLYHIKLT